jgi:fumarate reductase subunit D
MKTSSLKLTNDTRNRTDIGYLAFVLHRISGLAITLFLPLHFLLLGSALGGESALQAGLNWTNHPFFKFAETGLVAGLALHLALGIRLLIIERTGNIQRHAQWAVVGGTFALSAALLFALSMEISL